MLDGFFLTVGFSLIENSPDRGGRSLDGILSFCVFCADDGTRCLVVSQIGQSFEFYDAMVAALSEAVRIDHIFGVCARFAESSEAGEPLRVGDS